MFILTDLSLQSKSVVQPLVLKSVESSLIFLVNTLSNIDGKLLVYTSNIKLGGRRLHSITAAAHKIGLQLDLPVEFITFKEEFNPIFVYYKSGEDNPIPLYCDKGTEISEETIFGILRRMIFVLSFHPSHSALKSIRKEVMQFS